MSSNQYVDVSQQLADGIRMLQGQGHHPLDLLLDLLGLVELYHTSCLLLDGGTLTNYLKKVATFLSNNPNEVIIILWVNSVGKPTLPVTSWANSYVGSGLDKISYIPFMDTGANTSLVPYILDEFSQIWETVPNPQDESFPCTPRSNETFDRSCMMYLINYNLNLQITPPELDPLVVILISYVDKLNTTNAATGDGSISFAVDKCVAIYARNPTIILVDYYSYPPVNGVLQATLNKVTLKN